jgi:hypothetical protein
MEWMRPRHSDGPLHSVLLSTYGLSLSDPPFFEHDFLPTLLGLGGVRDRGYSSPMNVERGLGQIYCGLVCDAHALSEGGRPSLRVDVIPVGQQLHHAKIMLIHREHLVRLVITSANLTHDGFRRNREAAAVLEFHPRSQLSPSILAAFASEWLGRLGGAVTQDFRSALDQAVNAAQTWSSAHANESMTRILWGGGQVPLWRQIVDAWPKGEPLLEWLICSPFWPSAGNADTPFDIFYRELNARGANVAGARMKLLAPADVPGSRARPCFPFALVEQLARRGFNPVDATICPIRLDALANEVPEGKADDQRPLHAKWILLRGEHTSLLVLGSANFTRRGLGVMSDPAKANIEACVLLSAPSEQLSTDSIVPPIAENGIVAWRECRFECMAAPSPEIEVEPWPQFIIGIELDVRWETLPLVGTLRISCSVMADFSLAWEKDDELQSLIVCPLSNVGIFTSQLGETQISALLVRRRVVVRWDEPRQSTFFPINIASDSKPGLPAVLGQHPTEQDLLAYFHGRISDDDLMNLLMERARQEEGGRGAVPRAPGCELQNYVVREFLEGLYGMEELLRASVTSERAFEQALLGEFSPVRLASETQRAFAAGRRTPAATGFQLLELVRLVENLDPRNEKKPEPVWFAKTQERSLEQLLRIVSVASVRTEFRESCKAAPFRELVSVALKSSTAARWWAAVEQ